MDENKICSIKKKLGKKFKLAWTLIAVMLIIITAVSFIPYSKYKKVQEFAVSAYLVSDAISELNEFDDVKDDYNALVEEMYKSLNPNHWSTTINGYKFDNSAAVEAAHDADEILGDLIEDAGYGPCYRGSNYFEYIGYFDYTTNKFETPFIVWFALAVILLIINLLYALDRKKTLIIEEERIVCKNGKKTVKEFFIRDLNTVEATKLNGLKLRGNSIKYKINLLQNSDEIKGIIMDSLSKASVPSETAPVAQSSNIDELKKYKELLDMGVISQEEFDEKKQQLLNS